MGLEELRLMRSKRNKSLATFGDHYNPVESPASGKCFSVGGSQIIGTRRMMTV